MIVCDDPMFIAGRTGIVGVHTLLGNSALEPQAFPNISFGA